MPTFQRFWTGTPKLWDVKAISFGRMLGTLLATNRSRLSEGRDIHVREHAHSDHPRWQAERCIFTYSFSPIFDSYEGLAIGVLCMARDVTAAHQATLDRAESERKLAIAVRELDQVLSATTDSVFSVDREWRFTYLNPQAIQTYSRERSLVGKTLWEEFPDAVYKNSPYVECYERAMYGRQPGTFEAYYPAPLDSWLRISVFPTEDGFVSFSREITQEKRAAAVLLQTEKLAAVGRLASSISHEINNPLEAVTNLLYLVKSDPGLSQDTKEYLDIADRELARVSQLASHTLRFHRQSTAATTTDPGKLLDEVLSLYDTRLINAHVDVTTKYEPGSEFSCYEGDIRQVFNNLIGNAIGAMKTGGRLTLRTCLRSWWATDEAGVAITIADNGEGMDLTTVSRAFEGLLLNKRHPWYRSRSLDLKAYRP